MSVTSDGAHAVNAPSGIARADDAPTVHRMSHPCDAAADSASRADPTLPHTFGPGYHDAGDIRGRDGGLDRSHLLCAAD